MPRGIELWQLKGGPHDYLTSHITRSWTCQSRLARHLSYLFVCNDDSLQPASGFPTHGHKDMEIITYVTKGALAHKDSTGSEGVIKRGDVQAMSAGSGVRHSEFNASQNEGVHLFQIWIMPNAEGLTPAYAQTHFSDEDKRNVLRLLVGPNATNGSLSINQDAYLYASLLDAGKVLEHGLKEGRGAWVQLIEGALDVNGTAMKKGDGVSIEDVASLKITAQKDSEFLLFDLV
jgi:quercetin 2,3-dioxygenase